MVCTGDVFGSSREEGDVTIPAGNTDVTKPNTIPSSCMLLSNLSFSWTGGTPVPHSTSLKTVELPVRAEFGLISFLSMKEMQSLGVLGLGFWGAYWFGFFSLALV